MQSGKYNAIFKVQHSRIQLVRASSNPQMVEESSFISPGKQEGFRVHLKSDNYHLPFR